MYTADNIVSDKPISSFVPLTRIYITANLRDHVIKTAGSAFRPMQKDNDCAYILTVCFSKLLGVRVITTCICVLFKQHS